MNKEEFLCVNCGNETVIETFTVNEEIEFCPVCGVSKYNFLPENLDDEMDFDNPDDI